MKSDSWRWEQRDDVTLFELLNALWGRRLLVGGVALGLVFAAALLALVREPVYVAEAALAVSATDDGLGPEESGSEDPDERADADESPASPIQRVMDAVTPGELSRETMRRVGWTAGPREFNERLELEDNYATGEILVRFSSKDPAEARRIANEYAKVLAERTEELNRRGPVGGTLAAEAEVARTAASPQSGAVSPLFYVGAAGFVGLLLGGGIALVLESGTRTWRGARDAELTLRAPVLGVIPDYASGEEVG